jgi:glycosyltransferase involved in cell wall biosynthesis
MIVRNEESNLSSHLRSIDGLFDEIIIVDTGSTDHTVEIARSFGTRVFDFPWADPPEADHGTLGSKSIEEKSLPCRMRRMGRMINDSTR